MRNKAKRKMVIIALLFLSVFFCIFLKWQNNSITITKIDFQNDKVPASFHGYKILQLSDLHNKEFGKGQKKILKKIESIHPDIIVITGDLIDSKKTDIDVALDLVKGAIKIAPIYYVSGNHEAWSGMYTTLKAKLEEIGVTVLENQKVTIVKDDESIDIIGITDTSFLNLNAYVNDGSEPLKNLLDSLIEENEKLNILLSHRPELFDLYSSSGMDLVFSGHAHGGQFRVPLLGGLVAPDQGFFPKFTEGIHTNNNTSMVISRGLGNSIIPIRLFNRPELIVVTLLK